MKLTIQMLATLTTLVTCTVPLSAQPGGKPRVNRLRCTACGDCPPRCDPKALGMVGRDWTVADVLARPGEMADPAKAYRDNPSLPCTVDLDFTGVSPM